MSPSFPSNTFCCFMIFFKISISNFQIQNHSTLHICNRSKLFRWENLFEKEIAKLGQVKIRRNKYSGRFQALKSKFRPKDLSLIFFLKNHEITASETLSEGFCRQTYDSSFTHSLFRCARGGKVRHPKLNQQDI